MPYPLPPKKLTLVAVMMALSLTQAASAQQHRACAAMRAELTALNKEYTRLNSSRLLQAIQRQNVEIRRAQRDYRTKGCRQAYVNTYLSPICDGISDALDDMYDNLDALKQQAGDAAWVRRQRRYLTRKSNRLGCDIDSSVTLAANRRDRHTPFKYGLDETLSKAPRLSLMPNYTLLLPYQTVRTMCVRKSDGYYWPISFSTTKHYLNQDAATCQAQCPQTQVALYFHKTMGENVNNMVSLKGEKYRDLATAFLYRTKRDATQCKPESQNLITLQFTKRQKDNPVPPHTHQPLRTESLNIKLPPLDTRGFASKIADANASVNTSEIKTINSNGQTVRLVGPDTPYVRLAEEVP